MQIRSGSATLEKAGQVHPVLLNLHLHCQESIPKSRLWVLWTRRAGPPVGEATDHVTFWIRKIDV